MSSRAGEAAHADVALYGHWICPFATRVEFALHQRGIAHDLIDLPPSAVRGPDFVLPDEFVEHSPRLEIPMVRVGNDYLADSIPVLEWLEYSVDAPSLLPSDGADSALVQERMAWIDKHAFRAMIGVYYGVEPDAIAKASDALADALVEMGTWTTDTGWLAGTAPSLAEAVAMPIHVRMGGLQRLGFTGELTPEWSAHGERCRTLAGWPGVEWSPEQTDEFVGRFEAFRRKRRSQNASRS
ncbi:MAG: glutathione S-transferase family protein [Ilumatobacter sp.]|nr:glutathione S-transferase family protein [Phycisphaera sp.]MDG1266869.1 glutathione S-transferase family protein [Ilumatobacter sp.]